MSHGAPQLLAKHDSRCIYEGVSELIRIWVVEWVKQVAFLMKVKNEGEKAGLKLNIQKTKIMAPDPISSWQIDAETVEQWQTLFSWAPKITMDSDCIQEVKRHLHLERKAMTNQDSILKSKDTTLLAKVCLVKAMVFPVVVYRCESWTIKKAEQQRNDAF